MSNATARSLRGRGASIPAEEQSSIDVETVVRTYFLQIFRAARGAGLSEEQAEDVTQETFVTFVEKIDAFEGRSHVRTWLFGILYNKLREDRYRAARDRDMVSIESQSGAAIDAVFDAAFDAQGHWLQPQSSPSADVEAREMRSMLSGCMESAPTTQRLAFLLREVEGLSTAEICKILDVSATNLGVMLHRFRSRVRNCLREKGVA